MLSIPSAPEFPWYTMVSAVLLGLVLIGIVWTVLRLLIASVLATLRHAGTVGSRTLERVVMWLWREDPWSQGTAHWATKKELAQANVWQGTIPLAQIGGKLVYEPRGGHIVLFGPPRSHKSWGVLMPVIRQWPGSLIVNDLRGELFLYTSKEREERGSVFRFAPTSESTCCVNVLDAVSWGTSSEYADLHRVTTHLIPHVEHAGAIYHSLAIPIMIGMLAHLHATSHASLPGLLQWLENPDLPLPAKMQALSDSPAPLARIAAGKLRDMNERLRQSVWQSIADPLSWANDPLVAHSVGVSDFPLSRFQHGLEPTTLYLCPNFTDVRRLTVLLNLLIETMVSVFSIPSGTPRHKVLFVLDECANLGYLPELEKSVSYLQGCGVQVFCAFQNLPQVYELYGENTPLLASIGTHLHYGPIDPITANAVSQQLGQSTIVTTSYTHSIGESQTHGHSI